jgi:hypothetical protein
MGRRLASEIASALGGLPLEHQSVRSMAAFLDLDPTVCHRAKSAAQSTGDPLGALERSPGIAGLQSLAQALAEHGVKAELVQGLNHAIEQFGTLVKRSGGSHAKLQRRIASLREFSSEGAVDTGAQGALQRRRMFQATSSWLGTRLDTYATIAIAQPVPGLEDHIEGAKVSAFVGHRARKTSPPLVASIRYRSGEPVRGADEAPKSPGVIEPPQSAEIVPEFSSPQAARLSTHSDNYNQIQIIDRLTPGAEPIDTVVFCRMPRVRHPMFCNVPLFTVLSQIEQPCARLVSDVWLERDLAAGAMPDACMAWVGEPVRSGRQVPWYHRLPGAVTIQLLSARTLSSSAAWSRQSEATVSAFRSLGWEMSSFVGFRIEVAYPAWGSGVAIMFDYSRPVQLT